MGRGAWIKRLICYRESFLYANKQSIPRAARESQLEVYGAQIQHWLSAANFVRWLVLRNAHTKLHARWLG